MPIYEYIAEEDGTRLELIRPASQADAPVPDPLGKQRTFRRALSTFATGPAAASGSAPSGGCCPCGKNPGSCKTG
jgi:hypothetical protein